MLTGRETLGSIERALSELQRDEAAVNTRIERATRAVADLETEQLEAYRELARFRLSDGANSGLDGRLDEASREISRLLGSRAERLDTLRQTIKALQGERDGLAAARDKLIAERTAAAERLDDVMDAVDDRLEADPDYIAQKERADAARKTAAAARAKTEQAHADRVEKGQAYESDPLFLYLWNRGFGTSAYTHTGLVRMLDRWVARLIRYQDARPNYAMLTEIPLRLDAHADDREAAAAAELQKLADWSRRAAAEVAGEDLVVRIADLDDEIERKTAALDATEQKLAAASAEEQVFLSGQDDGFRAAQNALVALLQADDLRKLWREAVETPSPEDEEIVRRLQDLAERIQQVESDIEHDRSLLRDISRRREELARVSRNFRQRGYDSGDSTFSDDSLASVLLGELVKGAISGADYWARAERSHRRRKRRGRGVGFPGGLGLPGSMGGSLPDFGRGSRGGASRGGGGFKSGGSFGGGGFKTGETF